MPKVNIDEFIDNVVFAHAPDCGARLAYKYAETRPYAFLEVMAAP
jgi:hypothetical protein